MELPGVTIVAEALDRLRMGDLGQGLGVSILLVVAQPVEVRHGQSFFEAFPKIDKFRVLNSQSLSLRVLLGIDSHTRYLCSNESCCIDI